MQAFYGAGTITPPRSGILPEGENSVEQKKKS
jgi:hypothetical protein